ARQDDGLPPEPRRLRGDERGVREARRRPPAGPLDRRSGEAPFGRARRDRGDRPPLAGQNGAMRAETVVATHGNTDFDAFASMLGARRLYPDAVVAVSGSLSRNVREFAR